MPNATSPIAPPAVRCPLTRCALARRVLAYIHFSCKFSFAGIYPQSVVDCGATNHEAGSKEIEENFLLSRLRRQLTAESERSDIIQKFAMTEDSPSLPPQTVGDLMTQLRNGNREAASELVSQLYPELRRLAAAKLASQRKNYSWQPTLLVHELYLELIRTKGLRQAAEDGQNAAREKATFLSLAGIMMQRQLIEHARPLAYKAPKLDLQALGDLAGDKGGYDSVQYVEDILTRLEAFDPKLRTVLEFKVFMGMTLSEIGAQLGCSERTAASHWALARRWLTSELADGGMSRSVSRSPQPEN